MKISVVAGGAGFIGCNLLSSLAKEDRHLVILDNLCRGKLEYVDSVASNFANRIHFVNIDISNLSLTLNAFKFASNFGEIDEVWHLAANSDIQAGFSDPKIDLRDTFMTTFSLLQAMKEFSVSTMHFASSSAIYGDLGQIPLHESIGPLLPISNYGAMKLASEALISAAAEDYLERVNLFRFPNVVGSPATHGVIFDFINKLKSNLDTLSVLGDGTQQKSYLHVSDLILAMLHVRDLKDVEKVFPINIGPLDDGVTVRFIAESVLQYINPHAQISYGKGNKGWVGDVPKFQYSVKRLVDTGWTPHMNSEEAVCLAIRQIADN
jgi:UDP-glucose 4-epimerase